MKICVITLGCPKNVVDSEYLTARLLNDKVEFIDRADQADVVIINTCAFILPAREEAIETILEAVNLKSQGKIKRIYVTGCLPQLYLDELQTELPEVDGFFAQLDFNQIGRKLTRELNLESSKNSQKRFLQTPGHYAYLKISEGCDNRCFYCTIPRIKGNYQSWARTHLIDEAKQLVDGGVRELILVAQDTTYYGWEKGNRHALINLINSLAKVEQLKWIRILYAHPAHVEDKLIQLYNEQEKLCRYIDLPIQHISNKILKSMGRQIAENDIRKVIAKLRNQVPNIAIRTTLMVGYPGEDEEDFRLLKNFVSQVQFERLGVFKFIPESGTPAARLPDQIDEQTKEDRLQEIMELQYDIAGQKNQKMLGQTVAVIIDEPEEKNASFAGRTQWDSPLIDNLVHLSGEVEAGKFYNVTINRTEEYDLWGKVNSLIY